MKSAGGALIGACLTGVCLLGIPGAGAAVGQQREKGKHPAVITDGRLRPGRLETIRVTGFPGKGFTEVSFFPTAICEDACGAWAFRGGRTNAQGDGAFRVRVPGTFLNHRDHPVYFRNGERIEVNVVWEGPGDGFDVASADPEPILVRTHHG